MFEMQILMQTFPWLLVLLDAGIPLVYDGKKKRSALD